MDTLANYLANRGRKSDDKWWNVVLLETPHFLVIPSLGALVPGWLLLLPKSPYLSFSKLPRWMRGECNDIINQTIDTVRELFGQPIAFEHGPARPNLMVGCSVDHAHLHIVPCGLASIHTVISHDSYDTEWVKSSRNGLYTQEDNTNSKIYVEFAEDICYCVERPTFPSQLLRRVIAKHLRIPNEFDWREYPQLENVARTLSVFETNEVQTVV